MESEASMLGSALWRHRRNHLAKSSIARNPLLLSRATMWFSNYRQRLQLLVIAFFTFMAFAAADEAWMPWATLVVFLTMILLVDLLFLDSSQFQYNPDYKNWVRSVDPKY